jgi:hypothetical protein
MPPKRLFLQGVKSALVDRLKQVRKNLVGATPAPHICRCGALHYLRWIADLPMRGLVEIA